MKQIFTIALTLLLISMVSAFDQTINIKQSDFDKNRAVKLNIEQSIEPAELRTGSTKPEPEQPKRPDTKPKEFLFAEDWELPLVQSTPSYIKLPKAISNLFDVEYKGAFRVWAKGESSSNYSAGALGFNPENNSIYLAGKQTEGAIAEFKVPNKLSFSTTISDIPSAEIIQAYSKVVLTGPGQDNAMRVTGMLWHEGSLLVNSNVWYDGGSKNKRHMQIFDAKNISAGSRGYLSIKGDAKAAGYMSKIPSNLVEQFNSGHLMGWASNYSITNRYSQGPSLYTFDPQQAVNADILVNTQVKMVYPYTSDQSKNLVQGSADRDKVSQPRNPIWSGAKARYAFFVPNTPYLLVVGTSSGINSGLGYKITQKGKTQPCSGGCTFDPSDTYNYFWIYHAEDILSANEPHKPKPITYGKWSHPFDDEGSHGVKGAVFDDSTNTLYLTLDKAGQVGKYDRPPLIIAYTIIGIQNF